MGNALGGNVPAPDLDDGGLDDQGVGPAGDTIGGCPLGPGPRGEVPVIPGPRGELPVVPDGDGDGLSSVSLYSGAPVRMYLAVALIKVSRVSTSATVRLSSSSFTNSKSCFG